MNEILHSLFTTPVEFPLDPETELAIMASDNPQVAAWAASQYALPEHVIDALIRRFSQATDGTLEMLRTHPNAPLEHMRKAPMRDYSDSGLHSFAKRQGIMLNTPRANQIFAVIDAHRISDEPLGQVWDRALAS